MSVVLIIAIFSFCGLIVGQFIAIHKASALKREVAAKKGQYKDLREKAVSCSEEVEKVNHSIDSNTASISRLEEEIAQLHRALEKQAPAEDEARDVAATPAEDAS